MLDIYTNFQSSYSVSFAEHRGIISPAIIEHTGTVHVNQDEGAVLLCIAQSCPAPVYKYVKILYC